MYIHVPYYYAYIKSLSIKFVCLVFFLSIQFSLGATTLKDIFGPYVDDGFNRFSDYENEGIVSCV